MLPVSRMNLLELTIVAPLSKFMVIIGSAPDEMTAQRSLTGTLAVPSAPRAPRAFAPSVGRSATNGEDFLPKGVSGGGVGGTITRVVSVGLRFRRGC